LHSTARTGGGRAGRRVGDPRAPGHQHCRPARRHFRAAGL